MDQRLFTPLNQLETSLRTLLASLTNTNTYTAAPAATQSLLNADDTLSSALTELRQHQTNYARIVALRSEADRLQTQLRDIVRTCVELRSEIGQIHPSILDDTDDSEPDEQSDTATKPNQPVAYETLLSFAARIGKHNAAAAIEAERQSNRRPLFTTDRVNGTQSDNATQESLAELAAINDTLAQQRAYRGMAFPAGEALRMGELGRLQYIREQQGEGAVEEEIERLIRATEKVVGRPTEEVAEREEPARPEIPLYTVPRPQAPPSLPPKPKKALDLDFPGSDEDDD